MKINGEYHQFFDLYNELSFEDNNLDEFYKGEKSYNKYNENNEEYNDNFNYYFLCKRCKTPPEIIFNDKETINVNCECIHLINAKINILNDKYLKEINENNNNKINFCKCCKNSSKYYVYCDDCSKDICEQCFLEEEEEIHHTHIKLFFPEVNNNYNKIINNTIPTKIKDLNDNNNLKKIMNLIIYCYKEYPCYTNFKNVLNCMKFLKRLKDNDRGIYNNENKKFEYYIKIRNNREIKDLVNNHPDKINIIESIKINAQNFYDLNLLKTNLSQNNYSHLISLDLKQNNISDIKPLINIHFPQLISLNLSNNRLSDENIDTIKNLNTNCPKLEKLNLSDNSFMKYEIFHCCKNFQELKYFSIANNRIFNDYKNINTINLNFEFPPNLEELDASGNVFSNKSINIINNFKFNNLKKLYLNSNNLNSLSFVKYLNCVNLEEIWLSNNYLKEFNELIKLRKLKSVNLQSNQINNINNLNEFLKEFPNIEKIILSENKIDLNDIENDDIIEEAKKHRNCSNDKIQLFF